MTTSAAHWLKLAALVAVVLLYAYLIYVPCGLSLLRKLEARKRELQARRALLKALSEACTHPAWRAERLPSVSGVALRIACFRCGAPALDYFAVEALSDGSLSIVNSTAHVERLVIDNELHEMLPARLWCPYEDDPHESTYAVYVQPLRKA